MDKSTLIADMKGAGSGWSAESEFEWWLMMHSLDPVPPVSPAVLWQFFVVGLVEVLRHTLEPR